MARISMILCDLCKQEIKYEDGTDYGIILFKLKENKEKKEEGEICLKCYRSLLNRVKSPCGLPKKTETKTEPKIKDSKDTNVESTRKEINQIAEGEYRVPSRAHLIKHKESECSHDKKTFIGDGKFMCKECKEVLSV